MIPRLLRAVVLLPGMVLVLVPSLILRATTGSWCPPLAASFGPETWAGALLVAVGLPLAVWTVSLFALRGEGTPGPWDPPRKLVVLGPYRHVRNPMITSVLLMLLGEALLFRSPHIAAWAAVFFAGNAAYFPLIEEKGLERRFGEAYRRYASHVPRWIPRLRPWRAS